MGRPAGDPDTAWSRPKTLHRGRSPDGHGWPGCRGRPGRAGPPIHGTPGDGALERCVAPPPPHAAKAQASWLARNRSPQPAATAASTPTTRPSRGTSRRPRTPPPAPTPRMTATRQGRAGVQAAHSAARNRRHLAWAEPSHAATLAAPRRSLRMQQRYPNPQPPDPSTKLSRTSTPAWNRGARPGAVVCPRSVEPRISLYPR
jgi:hypothetical protein